MIHRISNIMKASVVCMFLIAGLSAYAQDTATAPSPDGAVMNTPKNAPPPSLSIDQGDAKTNAPQPTPSKSSTKIEEPQVVNVSPSKADAGKKKAKTMFAVFETSMGKFKAKLFNDKTPKTVDNFVGLAEGTKDWKDPVTFEKKSGRFYDGLTFHRIIKKFMIQGGDPEGTGMGGPGYEFADEKFPRLTFEKAGVLAMANRGPNTNGSQFFVTTDPATWLNGGYTIFGEVVEGMDVIKKISEVPTDKTNDRPLKPVTILKVMIIKK